MKTYKDQIGNRITLKGLPQRIVSLVPSQTQLLYDLGLEDRVVGITKFCIHPAHWFASKTRVGGTKTVNIDKVAALNPDLIIGNKEENTAVDIEALQSLAPVWVSDVNTLEDALEMIQHLSEITGRTSQGSQMIQTISKRFTALENRSSVHPLKGKSVVYVIWNEPIMAAGTQTFIHDMLERCGLENCIQTSRYPEITGNVKTDFVFLSTEPFPFSETHFPHYQRIFPSAKIVLVNGEPFSWYGSALIEAPRYFEQLLDKLTED